MIALNIVLSIITSIIASRLYQLYIDKRQKKLEISKYARSAGSYTGYGLKTNSTFLDTDNPLSKVNITYFDGNMLKLELKEINNPHEWHGLITMESGNYGIISWRYEILHGQKVPINEHQFGVKKFVYFPKDDLEIVYLIDETQGYDREILIRN
jgi:hypothetical protein